MKSTAMENKLQKTGVKLPIMDVGLDDHILNDDEAAAVLMAQTGLSTLSREEIRGLANLGIYVRGVGVLRTQRGQVAVNQTFLRNALKILNEKLVKEHARGTKARPEALVKLSREIANVVSAMTETQVLALNLEKVAAPTGKPDEVEPPRNTGFAMGRVIAVQEVKKELPNGSNGS